MEMPSNFFMSGAFVAPLQEDDRQF